MGRGRSATFGPAGRDSTMRGFWPSANRWKFSRLRTDCSGKLFVSTARVKSAAACSEGFCSTDSSRECKTI
ncbi:hypothetical protein DYH09_22090 [bacterium CPR1]|nr:hypothetical protein [bacterium CPR1]